MATYKTRGIIIKRSNFSEADRLVTIFTEKHGIVRVIAKGVRKPLSKLSGNIELFCLTDFLFAEGRNLDIVSGAEIIKCYFKMRNGLETTSKSFYFSEIIEKMLAENQAHPRIFVLLENVLENLNEKNSKLLISFFEINFLADIGYLPELYKCVKCGKKLEEKNNYFSFSDGGIVCADCKTGDQPISNQAIKTLRLFLAKEISIIEKIRLDKKLATEIEEITSMCLKHIHQQEFKSRRFIKE